MLCNGHQGAIPLVDENIIFSSALSVDLLLPSPVTREQDTEILKLLHLGQEFVPDPESSLLLL